MIQTNWYPSHRELRVFAAFWLVFFSIAGVIARSAFSPRLGAFLWILGGTVGLAGLVRPPMVRLVYVVWMGVFYPVGAVVSRLVLLAVFFLVITPVGLIQRLRGWDPMSGTLEPGRDSYWETRPQSSDLRSYFRQY